MGMKVKIIFWILVNDGFTEFISFVGIQYPKGIGQHDPFDGQILHSVNHKKHIVGRVTHTIGPVFKVNIHFKSHFLGQQDIFPDISAMFFGGFSQLAGNMF